MRVKRLRIRKLVRKQRVRFSSLSVTILILLLSLLTATALANDEAPPVAGVRAEAPSLTVTATHTQEAPPPVQEPPSADPQPATTEAPAVAPARSTDSQPTGNQSTRSEPVQTGSPAPPPASIEAAGTGLNVANNINENNNIHYTIYGKKKDTKSNMGVPDWKITLTQIEGGSFSDIRWTNNSGNYQFTDLGPGTYVVSEETRSGWIPFSPTSVVVILGETSEEYVNVDFLNLAPPASISGYKYNDLDEDGEKDSGEPGLPGWRINIEDDPYGFDYRTWTVTDENGFYSFTSVPPEWDSYDVAETPKDGWQPTYPEDGVHDNIMVFPGDQITLNFGNIGEEEYVPTEPENGTISGHKFNDINNNSQWDEGEPGLAGWVINIDNSDYETWTITDEDGFYLFTNVPWDYEYDLWEDDQDGWTQTAPEAPEGCGEFYCHRTDTLEEGENITDLDFGNHGIGSISGYKWNDLNGNGEWEEGELPLEGWKINISGPSGSWSVTTDENGFYEFISVGVGEHVITETLKEGWTETYPGSGEGYILGHLINVGFDEEFEFSGFNFGNQELAGSISGFKFNDTNGNGLWDAGEPPLEGWTINLSGPVSDSDTTDSTGFYKFDDLLAGTYTVSETLKSGWTQSAPVAGSYTVILAQGQNVDNQNFGNFAAVGAISGAVWNDLNGNGVRDAGEPVLPGWLVTLYASDGETVLDSQLSGSDGSYQFSGLKPGTYWVGRTPPPGEEGIWDPTTDVKVQRTIVVVGGEVFVTVADFGNVQPVLPFTPTPTAAPTPVVAKEPVPEVLPFTGGQPILLRWPFILGTTAVLGWILMAVGYLITRLEKKRS